MKNKNIRKYYLLIKILFPKINFSEGKFLHELKLSLIELEADNHNLTYEDIVNTFGSPETLVSDYISNQDPDYIIQCIKKKKKKKTIISVIILVLLLGLASWIFFLNQATKVSTDSVIEYQNSEIISNNEGSR